MVNKKYFSIALSSIITLMIMLWIYTYKSAANTFNLPLNQKDSIKLINATEQEINKNRFLYGYLDNVKFKIRLLSAIRFISCENDTSIHTLMCAESDDSLKLSIVLIMKFSKNTPLLNSKNNFQDFYIWKMPVPSTGFNLNDDLEDVYQEEGCLPIMVFSTPPSNNQIEWFLNNLTTEDMKAPYTTSFHWKLLQANFYQNYKNQNRKKKMVCPAVTGYINTVNWYNFTHEYPTLAIPALSAPQKK